MSQGGSDHPRGNPLPALHGIFTLRAAEVALGQDKVQSGVSRQKLVKGQGMQAGLQIPSWDHGWFGWPWRAAGPKLEP